MYSKCAPSLAEAVNAFLFGVIKHGAELTLLIFIEKEARRVVYHKSQSIKWEGTFFSNSCHGNIFRLKNESTSYPEPVLKQYKM